MLMWPVDVACNVITPPLRAYSCDPYSRKTKTFSQPPAPAMKVLWLVTTMPCVSHQDHLPLWVQGGVEVSTNDCPPPHDCPPPPPSPEVEFMF